MSTGLLRFVHLSRHTRREGENSNSSIHHRCNLRASAVNLLRVGRTASRGRIKYEAVNCSEANFSRPATFQVERVGAVSRSKAIYGRSYPLMCFRMVLTIKARKGHTISLIFVLKGVHLCVDTEVLFIRASDHGRLFHQAKGNGAKHSSVTIPPFSVPEFSREAAFKFPLFHHVNRSYQDVPIRRRFSNRRARVVFQHGKRRDNSKY